MATVCSNEEALEFFADISGGDARHALNAVELGLMTTDSGADGRIHITLEVAEQCIQKKTVRYDKAVAYVAVHQSPMPPAMRFLKQVTR